MSQKPIFRDIVQVKFNEAYAKNAAALPDAKTLKASMDKYITLCKKKHERDSVSSAFESSKIYKTFLAASKLLDKFQGAGRDHQILIAAALDYFVRQDDGINDTDYFFGLDDDNEVLRQVTEIVSPTGKN